MRTRLRPLPLGGQNQTLKTGGFVLTETIREPGLVLPRHCHEHTNIALVLGGSFIETVSDRPCDVDHYSLILRPAGEAHANKYCYGAARCMIIEVQPSRLEMIRKVSPVLNRAAHIKDVWVPAITKRLYREFRLQDSASPLSVEALVLELLGHASRQPATRPSGSVPRWLRCARSRIHEQFTQGVSLSRLAEAIGVHPAHLARTFRRHYHCTVGDYVRRLRLEKAADELAESDQPLAEIGLAAGFYDQSHFSHAFKMQHGLTPSEFRLAQRKGDTRKQRSSKTP